jgi:threonine dehydratase
MLVTAMWKCAVCGAEVAATTPMSWRCPNARSEDRRHVLMLDQPLRPLRGTGDPNPYIAFRSYLAWDVLAESLGMSPQARDALIREVDDALAAVAGTGFRVTPFGRNAGLSDALGFSATGGVWVKDETHNVAGSHKARHLFTELLHLVALERAGAAPWAGNRPPLAIASCGNAAFAAGTLASALQWPIDVFVPAGVDDALKQLLAGTGARIVRCPRRDDDPPGDPTVHRFREAVAHGAVPFGVQGTENAWCLDGGRTIGWEIADAQERLSGPPLDRMFVQIGGGAFATDLALGVFAGGLRPRVHAVQTSGCAPLVRAWDEAKKHGGTRNAGPKWESCMWPWEDVQPSIADGILDDETYDWVGVLNVMTDSGGSPIAVDEGHVREAYSLAHRVTDIDVSPTGSAGLAGLLAIRPAIADDERVVVVFSGIRRHFMPEPI